MFQPGDFTDALAELDSPVLDSFELFVENSDVKIYKKFREESGLYEYKTVGAMDCDASTCFNVYMDLEYRRKWDGYVQELQEEKCDPHNVILWNVKYPFPMSNRDYTFIRDSQEMMIDERKIWVVLAKSMEHSAFPEKSKAVRVYDYKMSLAIESTGKNKTKAFIHYYDNPRGSIPTWLLNWAAKKGVPSFLTSMKDACSSYPEYLQKN